MGVRRELGGRDLGLVPVEASTHVCVVIAESVNPNHQ